ncbi:MAG: IS66 family insertion sequence element accessory protein TnpB, partial [Rhodospirillaceae bacterium]|nr:IS66 family insertion sequence element accessory protein TnpB [Rhodospirillaceae bacterium]
MRHHDLRLEPGADHGGLVACVQRALRRDPFTGTVFVFRAKRADRLKLVCWDGTGLVMVCKRLEEQGFVWPAGRYAQFEALFAGRDWRRVRRFAPRMRCSPNASAVWN